MQAAAASFELSFWFWRVVSWFREARDHQCLVVLLTRQNLPANYNAEGTGPSGTHHVMGKEEEAVSQQRTLSFPAFILNSCWMSLVPTTTASLLIHIAYDSWFSHSNFVFFFFGLNALVFFFFFFFRGA